MNKPVAWIHETELQDGTTVKRVTGAWELEYRYIVDSCDRGNPIPLYTQDQLEEARKLGMQQERALWNLSESTQEIMNTHPVKEQDCYGDGNVYRGVRSKDSEIQTIHFNPVKELLTDEEMYELLEKYQGIELCKAILRKAQEK